MVQHVLTVTDVNEDPDSPKKPSSSTPPTAASSSVPASMPSSFKSIIIMRFRLMALTLTVSLFLFSNLLDLNKTSHPSHLVLESHDADAQEIDPQLANHYNQQQPRESPQFQGVEKVSGYPMIIHQSWKSEQVPQKFRNWPESWRLLNPDWQYHLWTDDANRKLIEEKYPWLLAGYDDLPCNIMRADLTRYAYMHQYGGVYADLDMECIQPLNRLIQLHPTAHLMLGQLSNDTDFPHNVPNAFMLSRPGHPFWLWVIHLVMKRMDASKKNLGGAEFKTGPIALKDALEAYVTFGVAGPERKEGVLVLEPGVIYPADWHQDGFDEGPCNARSPIFDPEVCKEQHGATGQEGSPAFTMTYWSHTWGPDC